MNYLRVAILVAAVCLPASVSAGELVLSFKDGRVTLKATDVSLRQILNEWARLGQTRMVGLEKLTGSSLTLELTDVPEKQALEILLRSVAGYIAAPRAMASARTRRDSIGWRCCQPALPRRRPWGPPDPRRSRRHRRRRFRIRLNWPTRSRTPTMVPNPPGIPVFNPNGEPVNAPALPVNPGGLMPGQLRAPGTDDPTSPAQTNGPAPVGTAPLLTTRPGVIPRPADATAPVSVG